MDDFNRLRLKHHGDPGKLWEILQAECRSKCARKLPDTLKCDGWVFPSLALAEMCTSDAVARVHAAMVTGEGTVLDMTAGLGIDAFHMAAAGHHVTAIELNHDAAVTLRHNASAMGLEDKVTVLEADSMQWLAGCGTHFDTIFIDPARRDGTGRHITLAQCQPDISRSIGWLLQHCHRLVVKLSPMADVTAIANETGVTPAGVTAIGTTRECKELVLTYVSDSSITVPLTRCITVGHGVFTPSYTAHADTVYTSPLPGQILLVPYPAVMKGCGGKVPGWAKLHPSSHLYVADSGSDAAMFPGTPYSITEVHDFNKANIRALKGRRLKANVVSRGFPLSAPEVVKRLGIAEGGDTTLFAATVPHDRRILIIARRLADV